MLLHLSRVRDQNDQVSSGFWYTVLACRYVTRRNVPAAAATADTHGERERCSVRERIYINLSHQETYVLRAAYNINRKKKGKTNFAFFA